MEVERVCRDSTSYNPERVKTFLLEINLPEPRPLIHVCDRFDFLEELTEHLYPERLKYIQVCATHLASAIILTPHPDHTCNRTIRYHDRYM